MYFSKCPPPLPSSVSRRGLAGSQRNSGQTSTRLFLSDSSDADTHGRAMPSVRDVVTYARFPRLPYPCTTRGHGPRHRHRRTGWPRVGNTSPWLEPYHESQHLKHHPQSRALLVPGAERLTYGERALAEGELQSLPDRRPPRLLPRLPRLPLLRAGVRNVRPGFATRLGLAGGVLYAGVAMANPSAISTAALTTHPAAAVALTGTNHGEGVAVHLRVMRDVDGRALGGGSVKLSQCFGLNLVFYVP
ncbi:hypothetical protein DFH09DRAFT_1316418 [Mycena vulgaris]|nr:hypothetical protein DFH09DRAFT_1316418 [Mycena vulgaris]